MTQRTLALLWTIERTFGGNPTTKEKKGNSVVINRETSNNGDKGEFKYEREATRTQSEPRRPNTLR
jgi:hypothetical protein